MSSTPKKKIHHDWRAWVVVGLMLIAMFSYIMTVDDSPIPAGSNPPIATQPVP